MHSLHSFLHLLFLSRHHFCSQAFIHVYVYKCIYIYHYNTRGFASPNKCCEFFVESALCMVTLQYHVRTIKLRYPSEFRLIPRVLRRLYDY